MYVILTEWTSKVDTIHQILEKQLEMWFYCSLLFQIMKFRIILRMLQSCQNYCAWDCWTRSKSSPSMILSSITQQLSRQIPICIHSSKDCFISTSFSLCVRRALNTKRGTNTACSSAYWRQFGPTSLKITYKLSYCLQCMWDSVLAMISCSNDRIELCQYKIKLIFDILHSYYSPFSTLLLEFLFYSPVYSFRS